MTKIEKIYYENLFKQFRLSAGMNKDETLKDHEIEFAYWLYDLGEAKEAYSNFFNELCKGEFIAELGKGVNDSVMFNLLKKNREGIIITPFIRTFDGMKEALKGELISWKGTPIIRYKNNDLNYPNINPIFNTQIDTLFTELPSNIVDLNSLINSCRLYTNIVIGSYGYTCDKDMHTKTYLLRSIKEQIISFPNIDCKEEYETQNGEYFHIISSKQKVLTKK